MNILILNDTDNWAGTESHILDLATALRAQNSDVCIACPPHSPLAARAGEIPIVPLHINKLIDRRAIQQLARLLKSGRAEVLHAHNGRTQLHGALAVVLAQRGALVWTQHFIAPSHAKVGGFKGAVLKRIHRAVNVRTHGFVAISRAVKRAMLERGEARESQIVVVPNGIADPRDAKLEDVSTVRARYGIAADAPLIVALCRLEAEKEVGTLLNAWVRVLRQWPAARLIIGGRGAMQGALQAQINSLGIANSAQLVGFVEDNLSLLNAADIFAHPAPAEPFGLVFLEAMALSKPVVACNGGAAPEIIVDRRCGYLFSPSHFEGMASVLGGLLNDHKQHSHKRGQIGRARYESHFTRERMAQDTLAVYQSVHASVVENAR